LPTTLRPTLRHVARALRVALPVCGEGTLAGAAGLAEPPRVLFVLRDAGETLALLPVLRHLQRTTGVNVSAVVTGYGTAPPIASLGPSVFSLSSLGVDVSSALANRSAALSSAQLWDALRRVRPQLVVSGLVSEVQLQIAGVAREQGTRVIGFDDSFYAWDNSQRRRWSKAGGAETRAV